MALFCAAGSLLALKITQLDAGRVGRLLGAFVHLVEEQRLLVDLDQGEGLLVLGMSEGGAQGNTG